MPRSYYSNTIAAFLIDPRDAILGHLTRNHTFALEDLQRNAWLAEIDILKQSFSHLPQAHIFFEFTIPRMGKRVDTILIHNGIIFVIEFKVGEHTYPTYAQDQVMDYALDLKNFHEGSHEAPLVPLLVATEADEAPVEISKYNDNVYAVLKTNAQHLGHTITRAAAAIIAKPINPKPWEQSRYKPTPTIIEAAQALYRGHSVGDISRSDSGAINLSRTAACIDEIIQTSKRTNRKSICFITGVPGSGKTLAGLNLANERHKFSEEEHAVFLSGNGPLVAVLQEALARNDKENQQADIKKSEALQKARAFIQNIHHFRDEAISSVQPPIDKIVVFDEAQRAWTRDQTSKFMSSKKGIADFTMSEPEFLISIMDRHETWAVIICLIGGGQEINTGEAGLTEWFNALNTNYPNWNIYVSETITEYEYLHGETLQGLLTKARYTIKNDLHLATSIRSFRSEKVSAFVKSLLDADTHEAHALYTQLSEKYPIVLTRNLDTAKQWVRSQRRGTERIGILASSGAYRLKPYGIFVQMKIEAKNWFLNPRDDIRSSDYLEDAATEFDVQGLELDWACVAWDADMRFTESTWEYRQFRGTKWQNVNNPEAVMYVKNAYRVLLTRARQGLVIFIPEGDDDDETRKRAFYNGTYEFFKRVGVQEL